MSGEPKSLDVVKYEMEEQRRMQAASIDALDSKIGILLGFIGVILTIYADNLRVNEMQEFLSACLVFLFLSLSFGYSILAYWVRGFRFDPSPAVLIEDYLYRDPEQNNGDRAGSKIQILADQVEAYKQNGNVLKKKARYVNWSAMLLGLGVLAAVANKIPRGE